MSTKIKAALIGFGTVGEGFYDILKETNYPYLTVENIVVNSRNKKRSLAPEHFSYQVDEVLENPNIDLIIEAITDAEESFRILEKALKSGKNVITASKKMVANYLPQIIELQKETGKNVRYEAAVCGSIPILQNLNSYLSFDPISSIEGVFNGTANFILTQVENGQSFEDALSLAQEKGLAEADPSSDIDGFDTRFKLTILNAHAFGNLSKPENTLCFGIRGLKDCDIKFGSENGWKIRLQAFGAASGERYVLPTFVSFNDFAYSLTGEDNFVEVDTKSAGLQTFKGKGAGASPTGLAVFGDVEQFRKQQYYNYPELKEHTKNQRATIKLYVRASDKKIESLFDHLYAIEKSESAYFITGEIALHKISQLTSAADFVAKLPEKATVARHIAETCLV